MRSPNAETYQDWKLEIESAFSLMGTKLLFPDEVTGEPIVREDYKYWDNKMSTDYMISEYGIEELGDIAQALWVIALAEYELRNDMLEERVIPAVAYHVYRYENMGRYKREMSDEEIEAFEKDVAYIKSKIELPELVSYEDRT